MEQGELCPSGSEITTSNECKHALEYAPLLGITHNSRKWIGPGNWGHVPFQCSYQAGGDQAFHYNHCLLDLLLLINSKYRIYLA